MTIATPALREMLLALLAGRIRQATVARAEAGDDFLGLSSEEQRVLRQWLGNGRPASGSRQIVRDLLDKLFPR